MPSDTLFKIKKALKSLFSKRNKSRNCFKSKSGKNNDELIAAGFTAVPAQYMAKYKNKDL